MRLTSPVGLAKTAALAAALSFSPIAPDIALVQPAAAARELPCGIPGGKACAAPKKAAKAKPFYSAMTQKYKPVSTAAFPKCKDKWDKDKPCPGGAGFRFEGDKRVMAGGMCMMPRDSKLARLLVRA